MRITPLDLRQTEFRTRLKGYDALEVQQVIQLAASELESLNRENMGLRQELHDAMQKLAEMGDKEALLKETLMEAQRTRQSLSESAKKEAELVIADAELRARELLSSTHGTLNELQRQIVELRYEKVRMRNEMRASLKTLTTIVDADEEADNANDPVEKRLHFFEPPAANVK